MIARWPTSLPKNQTHPCGVRVRLLPLLRETGDRWQWQVATEAASPRGSGGASIESRGAVLQCPSTGDKEPKNRLLNKYSGYLSSLWSSRGRRRKASCRGTRARSSSTGSSSTTGGPTPRYVIELFTRRPISIMPAGPTRSCPPLQQQLGVSRPHCFFLGQGGPWPSLASTALCHCVLRRFSLHDGDFKLQITFFL